MNSIDQNALYPIREVSRLTGVKPITLRAWERRYELIEPVRTESGHRLYTQDHIEFLQRAVKLVEKDGIPISRVKAVLHEQAHLQRETPILNPQQDVSPLLQSILGHVKQFNITQIERSLDRLLADYSLMPLLSILVTLERRMVTDNINRMAIKLWQTALTQRLQVRLHHFQTANLNPSKRIYIHSVSGNPPWLGKFIALFSFEQGYQPIQLDGAIAIEQMMDVIKPLNISGLILIDKYETNSLEWKVWLKHYAALRTWVFGDTSLEDQTPPSVNSELRAWPNWLKPLR